LVHDVLVCFACFITYLRLSLFNDIFVQGGNDENAYSKQAKVFGQENQPFTIFVDEAEIITVAR
jgi:hypothetical protein